MSNKQKESIMGSLILKNYTPDGVRWVGALESGEKRGCGDRRRCCRLEWLRGGKRRTFCSIIALSKALKTHTNSLLHLSGVVRARGYLLRMRQIIWRGILYREEEEVVCVCVCYGRTSSSTTATAAPATTGGRGRAIRAATSL